MYFELENVHDLYLFLFLRTLYSPIASLFKDKFVEAFHQHSPQTPTDDILLSIQYGKQNY